MALIMTPPSEVTASDLELEQTTDINVSATASAHRSQTVLSESTTVYEESYSPVVVTSVQSTDEDSLEATERQPCPPPVEATRGVIPAPEEFNPEATRRMAWIMQTGMDILLPQLSQEDKQIIEGQTDLEQLVISLFQAWEQSRANDKQANKTRRMAAAVYEKLKGKARNTELFDRFWSRKLADEEDDGRWKKFKLLVRTITSQVNLIDRVLGGANMGNVASLQTNLTVDVFTSSSDRRRRGFVFTSMTPLGRC